MTTTTTPIDPAALALPAPFVNLSQVTALDERFVRLSFAEQLGGPNANASYRAAVTMTAASAKELALTILTMVGMTAKTAS